MAEYDKKSSEYDIKLKDYDKMTEYSEVSKAS